jgi:hypothetical protein
MQRNGAGAFFVPNKLDGQGQRKANVAAIRALYVDADSRPEVERLHAFINRTGLLPTVVIASGGIHDGVEKLQGYWRVQGCSVGAFTDAQLTLVSRIGTDAAVQDAGRVMRLAGFWHQKREPSRTRIMSINPAAEYSFDEFMARLRAQPQIVDPWAATRRTGHTSAPHHGSVMGRDNCVPPTARLRVLLDRYGGLITPSVHALLREARSPSDGAGGNRHSTLVAIVARCVQIGWPDADIQQLVLPTAFDIWDVDRRELAERLDHILAWTRQQEVSAVAATRGTVWPGRAHGAGDAS